MKIKIDGKYYVFFNDFVVNTPIDCAASSFAFTAKFDPNNPDHRELFRPLSYHKVEFFHDDGSIFSTCTIVHHSFNSKATPDLVKVSGYSLGGVLEDCQIPHDMYPLESNNRTLREITERLVKRFGIKLTIYDSAARECDEIIAKSVADPGESIKDYISKIAAQKNIIFSHDIYGGVIFFKPDPKAKSKGLFNKENTVDMGLEVAGQGMHSLLTTIRQPARAGEDDEDDGDTSKIVETIANPLVTAFRTFVNVQTAGKETDTSKGVRNSLANELKNISIGFTVPNEPARVSIGDIVEIQNDECFIFKPTRFMISNTIISESNNVKNLAVTCVLPETYTGATPKQIFK